MKKFKYSQEILCGIILIVFVGYSLLQQGIICNDELLLRLYGQRGVSSFLKTTIINECLKKGRILGAVGNLKVLAFLSDNKYIFRTIDIIVIFSAIFLFCYLIYRLFGNKRFSVTLGILILVFMPITFEFAVPNAFVIVCLQPMILLILSLIFYLKYLEAGKLKNLIECLLLFFWGMCLYEFIVTYVFAFLMIYFVKKLNCKFEIRKMIYSWLPIVFTAVTYLTLYVCQGKIFPTQYSGTQLGIKSLQSVWGVIKMLFISACPGYYTFINSKHKYLFELYNGGEAGITNIINPVLLIFCIAIFWLLSRLFSDKKQIQASKKSVFIVLFGLVYCFLPALPNAVSLMYQDNVTPESFTSLPVSIYLYFMIMFVLTFVIWKIKERFSNNCVDYIIICLIAIGAGGVQTSNSVFAEEQAKNYQRIEDIEDVLRLKYWDLFGEIEVLAPSFFETRNSLAVESTHWTQYAKIYSKKMLVTDKPSNSSNIKIEIEMQDDNSFLAYWEGMAILITKTEKGGELGVRDIEKHYKAVQVEDCIWEENEYKIYYLNQKIN